MTLPDQARQIARAALSAVDPFEAVGYALATRADVLANARRIIVVGAGKASARMAEAVEHVLGDRIHAGWVNTKYAHGASLRRVICHECGHPVPDSAGVQGAEAIAALAREAEDGDFVLCLISGGASALLPLPAAPVTLPEKQETTRLLLASGASIQEFNAVRKHLSAIKGGRLAQTAAPARVLALILSDVVGDDLGVIGSGPTTPDQTTFFDAREILLARRIWDRVPTSVRARLDEARDETPKREDPIFDRVENVLIGSNRIALLAAYREAEQLGFRTLLLSSTIEGETRDVARMHAAILREACVSGHPIARPACFLSGGETTVTLNGDGKGGRNQEFALAAAFDIAGLENVALLSLGTDGTDGPTDAAGAFADGTTIARALEAGLDAVRHLRENDAYPFFARLDDLEITGPTRTNVMDIHVLLAGLL